MKLIIHEGPMAGPWTAWLIDAHANIMARFTVNEDARALSIRARVCTARSRLYVPPIRVSDVPLCVHSTPSTETGS